jgi:predicted  nucleic acid-binding Zn-ribbon protein
VLAAPRNKPTTAPPPVLAAPRSAKPTSPPPIPPPIPPPRPKSMTNPVPIVAPPPEPIVIVSGAPVPDSTLVDPPGRNAAKNAGEEQARDDRLAVPVGEFDHGATILEQDKLRIAHAQATFKRDAANAILGIAEAVPPPKPPPKPPRAVAEVRGDPTSLDPLTSPFERGDPTTSDDNVDGSRAIPVGVTGTLRATATLRRKRGLAGDVQYVFTVLFGVRRSRAEVAELTALQTTRQQSRRRHLVTLGRAAVVADGFDHPALGRARDQLQGVEEERSQHAGQVAAADTELARVKRDRETKSKQHGEGVAAVEAELTELGKKLEPLEREAGGVKKRVAELRESLQRIDNKIAATEASLVSVKGPKLDRAAVQAEIAMLKADREAVQRDEPVIASELDALSPRIAAIEAARNDARERRTRIDAEEQADQKRTVELLEAIGAKRKVVDRATSDAETLRDKILFELGERLYVDRPKNLSAQLAPIDEIDMELGTVDRRMMELREIISNVDRKKLVRGIVVTTLFVCGLGAIAGWLVYLFIG